MYAIAFPAFDPVIFSIGPFAIRWYALAYIAGLFAGIWYARWSVKRSPALMTAAQVDDFLLWVLGGVVLGGRLGYVLFYKPSEYLADPVGIFKTWEGGMSFHGGLLGVTLAIILYARHIKVNRWYVADIVAIAAPIGIALGRLANFVNGELWGRAADVPWAMVFPHDDLQLPRHPSQLYQFALEGVALFVILHLLWRNDRIRSRPGILTGVFWVGYGVFRIVGELFREPDKFLGYLVGGATMGQLLSIPMVLFGLYSIWRANRAAKAR
ncbi:MAG: prolipoprotein diacylglyceryl transferase [Rhodospirillaceae bacterium]|nr:prolipoprotein diacylglyceryl transferase [Rhodospirillaceae bacterium]